MPRRFYVAAGGGGDAIAAAMIDHASGPADTRPWIATYAWDRLLIDPLPGPRDPTWFNDLDSRGALNYSITPHTTVREPAGSTLPRLARELDAELFLLDPRGGALGLKRQLEELAELGDAQSIEIVDVGGDILAHGDEPDLRSPLADSLVLAAVADLDRDLQVLVAGPGLDGELSEELVLRRLGEMGSRIQHRLTRDQVSGFGPIFEWHPSEATGLLWAAAMGARGVAEIRDRGFHVALTENTTEVHRLNAEAAQSANRLAPKLAGTRSLDEADRIIREARGTSELEYERSKAATLANRRSSQSPPDLSWLLERMPAVEADALAGGSDFITLRRLGERLELKAGELPAAQEELRTRFPERVAPPLWILKPGNAFPA